MKTYVAVSSAAIAALPSLFRQTSPWSNVGGRLSFRLLGNSHRAMHSHWRSLATFGMAAGTECTRWKIVCRALPQQRSLRRFFLPVNHSGFVDPSDTMSQDANAGKDFPGPISAGLSPDSPTINLFL